MLQSNAVDVHGHAPFGHDRFYNVEGSLPIALPLEGKHRASTSVNAMSPMEIFYVADPNLSQIDGNSEHRPS
jgi:hypothetical protein